MPQVKVSTIVNCPIEKAFEYTVDFNNLAERHPEVDYSKQTSKGSVGEETTFDVEITSGKRKEKMHFVIKEYEPPYRAVLDGDGPTQRIVDEFIFTEVSEGTKISVTTDLTFKGSMKLIGVFIGPFLKRGTQKVVRSLAEALENLSHERFV